MRFVFLLLLASVLTASFAVGSQAADSQQQAASNSTASLRCVPDQRAPKGREHLVTLIRLLGSSAAPDFRVHVPPTQQPAYDALASEEARFAWLAEAFSAQLEQGDELSGEALGALYTHGLGVSQDLDRAEKLVFPGIAHGRLTAPRHCAEMRVLSKNQPAGALRSVILIEPLLAAGDIWSTWSAIEAAKILSKEDGKKAMLQAEMLSRKSVEVLSHYLDTLEPGEGMDLNESLLAGTVAEYFLNRKEPEKYEAFTRFASRWLEIAPQDGGAHKTQLILVVNQRDYPSIIDAADSMLSVPDLPFPHRRFAASILAWAAKKVGDEALILRVHGILSEQAKAYPDSDELAFHLLEAKFKVNERDPLIIPMADRAIASTKLSEKHKETAFALKTASAFLTKQWGTMADAFRIQVQKNSQKNLGQEINKALGVNKASSRQGAAMIKAGAKPAIFIITVGYLVLVYWITRRRGTRHPGYVVTALFLGLVIFFSSFLVVTGGWIAAASAVIGSVLMLLAVRDISEKNYLLPPTRAKKGILPLKAELPLMIIGLPLCIQVFAQIYVVLYEKLAGNPPPTQSITPFLQGDPFQTLLPALLLIAVFIPIVEEIFFRGILHGWLSRKLPLIWAALIGTSIFTILHGLTFSPIIFLLGAALLFLRKRYRSLWPPILMHMLNNAVAVVILYMER